jgi:hypothetical protein
VRGPSGVNVSACFIRMAMGMKQKKGSSDVQSQQKVELSTVLLLNLVVICGHSRDHLGRRAGEELLCNRLICYLRRLA